MATRTLTLLEILASRGTIARTSTAPNSWAAVSWWRRLFEIQEKEEDEKLEEIAQVLESQVDVRRVRPISAPEVAEARQEFSKASFRNLIHPPSAVQTTPEQVLNRPNLHIPRGEESLYLAQ